MLRESLYVVSPPSAGLQFQKPLALSSVAQSPLVLPAAPQGLRQLIDRACTIIGVNLNVVAESDNTAIQLELVERGVGYAILPACAIARSLQTGRLTAAAITEPELHRTVVIAQSVVDRNPLRTSMLRDQLIALMRPFFAPLTQVGLKWLVETD